MKQLYLMRHGIALDLGQGGIQRDFDRPLSSRGEAKTRAVAEGLAASGVRPALIGSSALIRARETAELVRAVLLPDQPVVICDFMAPGGSSAALYKWLAARTEQSVLLVGHMPDLSLFAARSQVPETRQWVEFKKAGCALIQFANHVGPDAGELIWYRPPGELRSAATELNAAPPS